MKREGSRIADEIISEWNKEKYLKTLYEYKVRRRNKDVRSILRNRYERNN